MSQDNSMASENAAFLLDTAEARETAERFMAGFEAALESKKRDAILSILNDELPGLAADETFIAKAMQALTDEALFEEKRFIFIAKNPKRMTVSC